MEKHKQYIQRCLLGKGCSVFTTVFGVPGSGTVIIKTDPASALYLITGNPHLQMFCKLYFISMSDYDNFIIVVTKFKRY